MILRFCFVIFLFEAIFPTSVNRQSRSFPTWCGYDINRNSVVPIIRPHRIATYLDAVYCYRSSSVVCLSVCLSVTVVSPAKTAESIEMAFGLRTMVGLKNRVLNGGPDSQPEKLILRGKGGALQSIWSLCGELCKNLWTDLVEESGGPKEPCIRWGPDRLKRSDNFWATVGHIKMKLGKQVGLGPGHIVLDGDPAPPRPKGHSPHSNFRPISVATKWLHGSRFHLVWR